MVRASSHIRCRGPKRGQFLKCPPGGVRVERKCPPPCFQLTLKKLQFLYFIGMSSFLVITTKKNFWNDPQKGQFFCVCEGGGVVSLWVVCWFLVYHWWLSFCFLAWV